MKYLLINLVLSSLIFLGAGSCSYSVFPPYEKAADEETVPNDRLSDFNILNNSTLFSTQIDVLKNHYSGITVIKALTDSSYRAVLVAEMGMKIFDLELFKNGSYKVHFIPEFLNKKPLVKTLANDLGLLLPPDLSDRNVKYLTERKTGSKITRIKVNRRKSFYFSSEKEGFIKEIIQVRRMMKKVNVKFNYNENNIDTITIDHYNFNLTIVLTRIKRIQDNGN